MSKNVRMKRSRMKRSRIKRTRMKRSRMKTLKRSRVKRKTNKRTVYNKKLYGGSNEPLLDKNSHQTSDGNSYQNQLFVDEGVLSNDQRKLNAIVDCSVKPKTDCHERDFCFWDNESVPNKCESMYKLPKRMRDITLRGTNFSNPFSDSTKMSNLTERRRFVDAKWRELQEMTKYTESPAQEMSTNFTLSYHQEMVNNILVLVICEKMLNLTSLKL